MSHVEQSRAIAALERLRPQSLDGVDRIALEANAIEEAIVESRKIRPCSWADLFRKSHSRRTYVSNVFPSKLGGADLVRFVQ